MVAINFKLALNSFFVKPCLFKYLMTASPKITALENPDVDFFGAFQVSLYKKMILLGLNAFIGYASRFSTLHFY